MMIRLVTASLLMNTAAPAAAQEYLSKPAALIADGMPEIPAEILDTLRPYQEVRSAGFIDWDDRDGSMLVGTQLGNVTQVYRVSHPLGMREQITFETEPVTASVSPDGSIIIVSRDAGGSEFNQLYRLDQGRLTLLTDGESRNGMGPWHPDGHQFAYTSTRRNGRDNDIYLADANDPSASRLIMQGEGGGWFPAGFLPGGNELVIGNLNSVEDVDIYVLDLEGGSIRPVGNPEDQIAYGSIEVAADGRVWARSDEGHDFKRLGTLDLETGAFTIVGDFGPWDVAGFEVSPDGATVAVITNEAGSARLYLYDVASGQAHEVEQLGMGRFGNLKFASDGRLGFSFVSSTSPIDTYSLDPVTGEVTQWTKSETGGLDQSNNVEPELVTVSSFDGEQVSGFLYLPDPAKFPGPRPLIMSIHGGPESQARAGFMGSWNYYLNELGIGVFLPNVRGSTGFGKRFVSLDNGPFQREDSVRDIGAFLDWLADHPAVDSRRIGVTGGSYGGYMCYATAIHYGDRVNGAVCSVAISNFVTFLENTQDYRRDFRRGEYGDERDPVQREKLFEISPMTRAAEIEVPLFVIQGANDPRVPKSEADQIVAEVRSHGHQVWYLVGENEGHGFLRKENSDYQVAAEIHFWSRLMGETE